MNVYLLELLKYCRSGKYTNWHNNIIEKALSRNWKKISGVGQEKHHILPKSFGGDNTKENYVVLSSREHFIIHLLLLKIVTDKNLYEKMIYALFNMKASNRFHHRKNNSRYYQLYKIEWQSLQSQRQKTLMADQNFKNKVIETRAKTLKNNPEISKRISEKLKGRKREGLKKDILILKGEERTIAQKEASLKHSIRMLGRTPWNKGKPGRGKSITTPDGIFKTGLEACKFYNISSGALVNRCKKKLFGFSYTDDQE